MVLHQRLRRLTESWRTAVGAERQPSLRQAGSFARDGAGLGARAEGPGDAMGHGCEYGGFGREMKALGPIKGLGGQAKILSPRLGLH
jgi:hypothetical protein